MKKEFWKNKIVNEDGVYLEIHYSINFIRFEFGDSDEPILDYALPDFLKKVEWEFYVNEIPFGKCSNGEFKKYNTPIGRINYYKSLLQIKVSKNDFSKYAITLKN